MPWRAQMCQAGEGHICRKAGQTYTILRKLCHVSARRLDQSSSSSSKVGTATE